MLQCTGTPSGMADGKDNTGYTKLTNAWRAGPRALRDRTYEHMLTEQQGATSTHKATGQGCAPKALQVPCAWPVDTTLHVQSTACCTVATPVPLACAGLAV